MLRFLALASFFLRCWSSSDIVTFLLVGDWGGNDLPPYTTPAEVETASSMGKTAERLSSSFQISLGDNFYHHGVKNVNDPRFRETFEASCTFDASTVQHAISRDFHVYLSPHRMFSMHHRCNRRGSLYWEITIITVTHQRRLPTRTSVHVGICRITITPRFYNGRLSRGG